MKVAYCIFKLVLKKKFCYGVSAIFPTVTTATMNALVVGVTMGVMGVMMISVGVVAESDPAYHAVPAEPVHGYCANGGVCVEPVLCSPWYLESLYDPGAACYLGPSTPGVCCAPKKPACKYFFYFS